MTQSTDSVLANITQAIQAASAPERAAQAQRFFKTGPGEYGEGDTFLGLTMPEQRRIAKQFFVQSTLETVQMLLESPWHEYRMVGLLILTYQYPKATNTTQKQLFEFYLKNTAFINNWDLVDVTCHEIVGTYLLAHPKLIPKLTQMASRGTLWEKRIAMVSTYAFIRQAKQSPDHDLSVPVQIATVLVNEKHDLLQKAVGWMLREVGKVDEAVLLSFLDTHAATMPRTSLRYSLERLSPQQKQWYMGLAKKQSIETD